ncbi:MAG: sodium:solute symporter [Nitrospiraceae bacterium]|nr:sodium:solute symporter [Nitrospiraceae bacterium]
MNLGWVDWSILVVMLGGITAVAYTTKKHTRSVADFLAANRCAGKYLLAVADGISGLGAITVVALFEMYYKSGFSGVWWSTMLLPFGVIIALIGWIQYRYRQTRVLTMAQFMEIRYSRRFRVFAGIMAWVSGILNFGIFPAVGARFFQYYCGLPQWLVAIAGREIDLTFAIIMLMLLTVSLAFTFMGGQIAVIVTDFLQGAFCNIAFCVIGAYLLFVYFDWSQLLEAFSTAPADASLLNPAHSGETDNFNSTYFLVGVFGAFLNFMAWQGSQGYFASAESPHAARMGRVIGSFRPIIQTLPIVLLAVGAYTVMNHQDFSTQAAEIQGVLDTIDNPKIQDQQTVPIAVAHILPVGLVGIFAAVMLAAFISTHDTYLHSWGSIFIQDVILPIRQTILRDNRPMSPKAHLWLLRISILAVAIFIFFFSLLFKQQQDILMFFALTGTFFLGWAGWTICGGLYWKYGNTAGAWVAAVVGLILSIGGWYLTYFWENCHPFFAARFPAIWQWAITEFPKHEWTTDKCPFSAQILYFWSMVITGIAYVGVSLLASRKPFDMDKMLHRGEYAVEGGAGDAVPKRGLAALRWDKKFTWDDKIMYVFSLLYTLVFFGVFLAGTVMFQVLKWDISDTTWGKLWWGYCVVMLAASVGITVWLTIGGVVDFKKLYRTLSSIKRDIDDDGTVVGHQSLADLHAPSEPEQ